MEVADEFLLVARAGGRSRVRPRTLGVALAGGLLGELLFAGKVAVAGDAVWVVDRVLPPLDSLAHSTLDRVAAEPGHSVPTWLEFLGRDAEQRVTDRLVRGGHLVREESRRWGRTETRYVPVDPARAAWPEVRLGMGTEFDGADGFLAGLVLAADLGWRVFRHAGPRARELAAEQVARLPDEQRDLIEQVRVVVSDGVLTHRS